MKELTAGEPGNHTRYGCNAPCGSSHVFVFEFKTIPFNKEGKQIRKEGRKEGNGKKKKRKEGRKEIRMEGHKEGHIRKEGKYGRRGGKEENKT